jgi:SAM-dependent methyltransferase
MPAIGTFRDPQGRLYLEGDRVLREIYPDHVEPVLDWLQSPIARDWMRQGRMIPTIVLSTEAANGALLEHERLFFPTYPWEWSFGQWRAAAALTLDLCEEALGQHFILKDATPLNVLFRGPDPVFVDVLSFEVRDPRSPLWMAYAQFVRTFLLPLAAYTYLGWPLGWTQQRRDGYESADLAPWLPTLRKWRNPLRSLVSVPMLLEKRSAGNGASRRSYRREVSEEVSGHLVRLTVRNARKLLDSLAPPARASRWSDYTEKATHYEQPDRAAKDDFVRRMLDRIRAGRVLDVGANTGAYSRIAAKSGAEVVAWDTDTQATELNWGAAQAAGLHILPLVADFARPAPALGWQNSEQQSLLSRAQKSFDCVMMLGILHHLLLADQIPLASIVGQLAAITRRWAILEWIPQEDPQFADLCRGRESLYGHLTENNFLDAVSADFVIRDQERLPNGRSLWLVEAVP